MKLLLTSAGIKNPTIHEALVQLLGKPVSEANALCVATGIYPFSGGPQMAYQFISGKSKSPMCQLGWKSLGVLEPTLLPFIPKEVWMADLQAADVLLVYGGDPLFLRDRMRDSGLADVFASLPDLVYVGVSAGSMVLTSHIGETFFGRLPPEAPDIRSEEFTITNSLGESLELTFFVTPGLGLVNFSIFPHLESNSKPDTTTENVATWASRVPGQMYGIDDQTAIKVVDGDIEVVSEGRWKLFS